MKHRCNFTRLEPIDKVIENPRNPNQHPENQIELLAKILDFQGWRLPIVVSKRSGFVVRGHGRLMAARKLGLKKVPIDVQTYDNEAQEWADLVADNRIAELAEMDRGTLKDIIEELDTGENDLEMTGFRQSDLDLLMSQIHQGDNDPEKEWEGMPEFLQEDETSLQRVIVHFKEQEDIDAFAKLVDQKITPKTRSMWYPEAKIETYADKVYEE